MTILKKLVVKGIRSYNPNKEQSIDFQIPLTLIVGQNGTGKTTLIECLKYITTGTLPPNAKGGAFIYDGGLANNTEVKAEIKLHLHDFYDREIVIQKIIQSSIKQKKTEQKVLEFNVWVNNNVTEIIDFNNTVRSTCGKINKDDLTSVFEINTSVLENVIFCHQDDAMWYLAEPATIKKKFDDIFSSTRYSKTLDNLKKAKKEITTKVKVIYTELSFLLKLRDKKYEIENRCRETKEELETKTCNISGMEKNLLECSEILKNLTSEHSKITIIVNKKKEISDFKNLTQIKYSESECKNLLDSLNIECKESEIINLEKKIKKENQEIKVIEDNKEKYEKIQKEIEILKVKKNQIHYLIEELTGNIFSSEKWLINQKERFQSKLKIEDNVVNTSDYKLVFKLFFEKYEQELNRKIKIVTDLKTECDKITWEIEENKKKIKSLEHFSDDKFDESEYFEVEDIDVKIKKLEEEYETTVKMTRELIVNEEKRKRRDEMLLNLKNKTKSEEIENVKKNTEKIKTLKIEIKKLNDLSNKLNYNKTMIINKFAKFNSKIYESGEFTDDYKLEVICLERDIIDKILKISLKNNKCYICEKEIDDCSKYKNKLLRFCNNNRKIHENNFKIQKDICDLIKSYNLNTIGEYRILKDFSEDSISDFPRYVSTITSSINDLNYKFESDINEKEMTVLDLEEDNVTMKNNIKMFFDIENMNIKNIDCASLEEIQNELKRYKACKVIKDKKDKIVIFNELVSYNLKLSKNLERLNLELKVKSEKLDALKNSILRKKTEVELKLNEFYDKKEKFNLINIEMMNISSELDKLLRNDEDFNLRNFNDLKEQNLKNSNLLITLKNELSNKKDLLVSIKEHIEYYKNINKFKRVESEIRALEDNLKNKLKPKDNENNNDKNQLNYKHNEKTQLNHKDNDKNKLNHKDNDKNQLTNKDNDKNQLNHKDNIITGYLNKLNIKIQSIKNRHIEILEKINILKGEINQLKNQCKNLDTELKTEYKNVIIDYNKKYVENKILELSINDIDRCISVLDKSIIDYHYNKIEEINLNLKELWGNCYKGNDIDCIKLKINENGSKNYSYKMMIVKNNIELDMRNRSSAGQKMIGNILLRIALSKVFCCNFNVLTLDEPTTNLDKENVESLAYTLVSITKTNPNLQLIIITHDEDFLSIMCRENLEYFYRITRNRNGDSVIIKEKA